MGEHHRKQWTLLNPVFPISHVRDIVSVFFKVMKCLQHDIAAQVEHRPCDIDMLEWLNCTALELVGQSGLGYSFDYLKEGYVNPYSIAIKNLVPAILKVPVTRRFLPFLIRIGPPSLRKFVVKIFPWKALKEIAGIVDIMDKISIKIFEEKKIGAGKDIMSKLRTYMMSAR
ncbi:hypothetical protein EDB19DRAFT_894368 [Suillus lakei]|nr:hypothetical protein EDB19DRAFT_894368 [Suillus lakei]